MRNDWGGVIVNIYEFVFLDHLFIMKTTQFKDTATKGHPHSDIAANIDGNPIICTSPHQPGKSLSSTEPSR